MNPFATSTEVLAINNGSGLTGCKGCSMLEQEKCKFFVKASYDQRCLHLVFDEYCDCSKAQDWAKGKAV